MQSAWNVSMKHAPRSISIFVDVFDNFHYSIFPIQHNAHISDVECSNEREKLETFFARWYKFRDTLRRRRVAPIVATKRPMKRTQASKYTCRSVSDVCARGIERPGSEIRDPAFHLSVSHTRVDVSTTRDFWFFFVARRLFASPSLELPNKTVERLFNRIPYEQVNARSLALHSAQPWPRFRSKRYCQLRSGRKWIARSPRDI